MITGIQRVGDRLLRIRNAHRLRSTVLISEHSVKILDVVLKIRIEECGVSTGSAANFREALVRPDAAAHHHGVISGLGPDELALVLLGSHQEVRDHSLINNDLAEAIIGEVEAAGGGKNRRRGIRHPQPDLVFAGRGEAARDHRPLAVHAVIEVQRLLEIDFPIPRADEVALGRVHIEGAGAIQLNILPHGGEVGAGGVGRGRER